MQGLRATEGHWSLIYTIYLKGIGCLIKIGWSTSSNMTYFVEKTKEKSYTGFVVVSIRHSERFLLRPVGSTGISKRDLDHVFMLIAGYKDYFKVNLYLVQQYFFC